MSSTLPTKRVSRSASSCTVPSSSSRVCASNVGQNFRKLVIEPMMEASGVFRSCEIEVSSAARKRSVSPVTRASSMPAASEMRSIATAAWSASASSRRRSSGDSSVLSFGRSSPMTPTSPRSVRSGRNRRLAPGSVSEERPATWPRLQLHLAAARSASSSSSSGG